MLHRTCNLNRNKFAWDSAKWIASMSSEIHLGGPTESENYLTSWLNTKFWREVIDCWRRAKYADSARFEVLTALLLNIQTWLSSLLGLLDSEDDGITILRNVRNSFCRPTRTAFTLALFVREEIRPFDVCSCVLWVRGKDVRPFDVMASNRSIPVTNTLRWSAVVLWVHCRDVRLFDVMTSNPSIPVTNTLGWSAFVLWVPGRDVGLFDVMTSNRSISITNTLGWSAVVSC
jgi:hypothetical protein